jgi:phage terminase large subunit GpA-like protein
MLAVQPTTELAKRFSDQRIDPLIEETPAIRERVAPARSRDSGNRQLSKEFPGGQLVMTGANSAVGLRSMSARFLFLDEIDAYPGDVEGEGDPIALAEARARTFGWRRKTFLVSTPTIAGLSRIEREYLTSDQRRFFVATFKSETYRFLRLSRPTDEELAEGALYPAGYVHLPRGMEAEWVKQLVAEQLVSVRTRRGFARLEWQKLYNRNEVLDCRVYARAAAWIAGADRWTEATWRDLAKQVGLPSRSRDGDPVAPSGDDARVPPAPEHPVADEAPPPSAGVLRRRVLRGRRVFTPSYLR